jgi:hypothetical protein
MLNKTWNFNGDFNAPTLHPSVLVTMTRPRDPSVSKKICHSFIKDGFIQFLGDCTHELAGKTVKLPEVEDQETEQ